MEIRLQMNPKFHVTRLVPIIPQNGISLSQRAKFMNMSISCRVVNEMAMHNKEKKKTNFYELLSLGTAENVGFDEIKKAYRSMARRYHPDVCPPSEKEYSTRRFIELQRAYETLSNPVSRKMYDFYELGLVDDHTVLGFGHMEGLSMESRRSVFPKQVWEDQLCELKRRSQVRMKKRKKY
ncbi:hypothetical protein FNV43_RR19313 [Rhamnella rubrinervis]|uniref:J domain-containing protein n=1 Tax=Rhamnella rubrinervis TaxID=2594499 RepID=A0A8K0GTR3_9ROSA|nr:hypothetical protein FNV43_RR19313 [Rhamnella rubrinervis]